LPLCDKGAVNLTRNDHQVIFIGFLQVFINAVDQNGNANVKVLDLFRLR
jgi:hypothetical protein